MNNDNEESNVATQNNESELKASGFNRILLILKYDEKNIQRSDLQEIEVQALHDITKLINYQC